MRSLRSLTPSNWTRLLLAALAVTLFALVLCGFLAAVLSAAGDIAGQRVFSAFNIGLAVLFAAECVALLALIAIRLEWPAPGNGS
ncbi:MAG TPA: hypothetical protein VM452_02730 [Caulifigura sp.]|nr:hypothetical protein [Caulifigura sp.]